MLKPLKLYLLVGSAALAVAVSPVRAQTPPSLGLSQAGRVILNGTAGSVYVMEYTVDLTQSNSWTSLAFVQPSATNLLFVDTNAPAAGSRFYRAQLQNPPTNMVFIPSNTFTLGSPSNEVGRSADEGPQTVVTFSHGFWIGKFDVT